MGRAIDHLRATIKQEFGSLRTAAGGSSLLGLAVRDSFVLAVDLGLIVLVLGLRLGVRVVGLDLASSALGRPGFLDGVHDGFNAADAEATLGEGDVERLFFDAELLSERRLLGQSATQKLEVSPL